jgi:hypothetical protein
LVVGSYPLAGGPEYTLIPGVGATVVPSNLKYKIFPPQHGSKPNHEAENGGGGGGVGNDIT